MTASKWVEGKNKRLNSLRTTQTYKQWMIKIYWTDLHNSNSDNDDVSNVLSSKRLK